MAYPKVLLWGHYKPLEALLRTCGGPALQIETLTDAGPFQTPKSAGEVGMVVILHRPEQTDGLSALRIWKRRYPGIPAIVITSDYSGATTRLLLKSGAEDVLGMPVSGDELLACLEEYMPGFRLKPPIARRPASRRIGGKALLATVTPGMVAAGVQMAPTLPPVLPDGVQPTLQQDLETAYKGLEIAFFGPFTMLWNGRRIELTNQAKYLFAYLAYNYPRALSRDHLARTFWPEKFDHTPEFARKSLNVELTHIRNIFRDQAGYKGDLLVYYKNTYSLKLESAPISDVLIFKDLHQKTQEYRRCNQEVPDEILQKAIKTYSGNFLDDFPADSFSWVELERQHLSSVFEQIADLYSAQLCSKNDYWKAVAVCNDILSCDARMEVIHRRVMQCYASLGMAHKVEAQFNLCCKMMEQEFQSMPSSETVRLYEEIKKKVA